MRPLRDKTSKIADLLVLPWKNYSEYFSYTS